MEKPKQETMNLGGGIQLSGFGELEPAQLVIVKKMVGNYIQKIGGDNILAINLKKVHPTEKNCKYELKGKLEQSGQIKQAEITDYNIFFALNKVLTRLK